jgi:hypothetical protein
MVSRMKAFKWIRLCFTAYVVTFAVLVLAGFARGRDWAVVLADSALWAGITAAIYVAAQYYHSSRGRQCELCRDTSEAVPDDASRRPTQ